MAKKSDRTRNKKAKRSEEKKEKKNKLPRKKYESELAKLQGELVKLQLWVREKGLRIVVVFEGRDAAGKGGAIKRITERVSPRTFRVVALPAPTEREKSQMYMPKIFQPFPCCRRGCTF